MVSFYFRGQVAASKSLMNRALIVQSFCPQLEVIGNSGASDVTNMKQALHAFFAGEKELWVGEGGTVLRFLLFRVSRQPGRWILRGTKRLFSRPQSEGEYLLKQLGVSCTWGEDYVIIESQAWQYSQQAVSLTLNSSSQFASGLVLCCLNLDQDISLVCNAEDDSQASWSYFLMTLGLLERLGVPFTQEFKAGKRFLFINKGALPQVWRYVVEPDWSNLAALLVAAKVGGQVELQGLHSTTYLQPDAEILRLFDVDYSSFQSLVEKNSSFQNFSNLKEPQTGEKRIEDTKSSNLSSLLPKKVELRASPIHSFSWSFQQTPDLLPVLAVLAAFSEGDCLFTDFERATLKESDRVSNTLALLSYAGVPYSLNENRLIIHGQGLTWTPRAFTFDPDQDHRMAMAAGIFKLRQPKIKVLQPEVVNKSFPEFWRILGMEGELS